MKISHRVAFTMVFKIELNVYLPLYYYTSYYTPTWWREIWFNCVFDCNNLVYFVVFSRLPKIIIYHTFTLKSRHDCYYNIIVDNVLCFSYTEVYFVSYFCSLLIELRTILLCIECNKLLKTFMTSSFAFK